MDRSKSVATSTVLHANGKMERFAGLVNVKDTHRLLKCSKGRKSPLSVVVGIDVNSFTAYLLFISSLLK